MHRRLFSALVLSALVAASPADASTTYRPPVDAPVVDAFRLPDGPYGAGNRGLEYATQPGDPVHAIGDGLVVFAGPVPGSFAVTVLHPDGLRSSYSYLAEVTVTVGEHVAIGDVVGRAGEQFQLGVRAGGTYLDPAALFATVGVHLVPVDDPPATTARVKTKGEPVVVARAWGWLTGTGSLSARS